MPKRIQRKYGQKMPPNAAYVGPGTKFATPFRIVRYSDGAWAIKTDGTKKCGDILVRHCHAFYLDKTKAQADAVICFNFSLVPTEEASLMAFYAKSEEIAAMIEGLRGKDLACWCKEGDPCHADVLLEIANM